MTVQNIIVAAFWVLETLILVRVVLSWVRPGGGNSVIRFVYDLTDPILAPIRRILPSTGMFDFSPWVALLLLSVIERFIRGMLLP